jgi:hypothetical protein
VSGVKPAAPLSGLAFALLFGFGSGLWVFSQPSRGADTEEIRGFFEGTSTEILIGGTISIVSIVFLVWFGAVIRERLSRAEGSQPTGLPLTAFAGAVLLGAVGLAAETINMAAALSAEDGRLTDERADIYFGLTYAFGAHSAGAALAIVALPIAVTVLRTGQVMSRSAGWGTLVFGLAMLTPAILNRTAFLVLYALTLVLTAALSIHLWRTTGPSPVGESPAGRQRW